MGHKNSFRQIRLKWALIEVGQSPVTVIAILLRHRQGEGNRENPSASALEWNGRASPERGEPFLGIEANRDDPVAFERIKPAGAGEVLRSHAALGRRVTAILMPSSGRGAVPIWNVLS
jgi:hypothetical protein